MRNIFIYGIASLMVVVCWSGCSPSSSTAEELPPNIILIMADDLGYGDIGCFGNQKILTPHLDLLAKEGLRLTDYHSNGAICSPTRAALMTGRYQQRAGIDGVISAKNHRETGMSLEERTIAEEFTQNGYATAIFGKWHLGYQAAFGPFLQGFQTFRGYVSGNIDFHSHIDQAGYEDWWRDSTLVPEAGYVTDLIAKHGLRFIRENKDRPFFLYLPHEAPHYPYQGRNDKADRRPGEKFPVHGSRQDVGNAYKEMVEVMDETVGKIVETVRELGLADRTMIVFVSDNGATAKGSNGKLRGFKGSLLEGGHRVPGIVWWPGKIPAGTETHETILGMDWYPTIGAIANLEGRQADRLDGIDVSDALFRQQALGDRAVFWHFRALRAMREGNWKLLWDTKKEMVQLFNLASDLGEQEDLSAEHPERVEQMRQAIEAWEQEVKEGVEMRS
ncbi:MAG: sulfatase-like hydrolase/transferase [Bacteroidota bacterium]